MAYSMKMGHKWVLEAQIGLQWPILGISPLKLAFFDIELPLRPPKI